MPINLIDRIKPANDGSFPMVEAVDVELPDGRRLDKAIAETRQYSISWIFPKDENESNEEYEERKKEITQYNLEVLKTSFQSGSNNLFLSYGGQVLPLTCILSNNPDTVDGDMTYIFTYTLGTKITSFKITYMPYKNEYHQYEQSVMETVSELPTDAADHPDTLYFVIEGDGDMP